MAAIHRRSVVVRGLAAASAAVEAGKHGCYIQAEYGDIVLPSLLLHSLTANSYAGCASLQNRGLYIISAPHPSLTFRSFRSALPTTNFSQSAAEAELVSWS